MSNIKYVVVCKKGYCFASEREDVIDFIEKNGTDIAYYIGYFKPITNISEFLDLNTNIEDLGTVVEK